MNIVEKEFDNPLVGAHTPKIKFQFDEDSLEPVSQTLKNGAVWSSDIAALACKLWKKDSNIVDIGTHIGTFSCLAASFTRGRVISIEPEPSNFAILLKNKEINNFTHQTCYNFAASDKAGEVAFCSNGPSSHVQDSSLSEAATMIPAKPLDSILKRETVDFIKIDVEGWELNVLEGLKETIQSQSPPILIEVNGFTLKWFDHTPNDLLAKLESFGYRLVVIYDRLIPINSYEPFPFGVVDCLAIKDHHIPFLQNFAFPLSPDERKRIWRSSYSSGNQDMLGYFNWYKEKYPI